MHELLRARYVSFFWRDGQAIGDCRDYAQNGGRTAHFCCAALVHAFAVVRGIPQGRAGIKPNMASKR
eukprot:3040914-Lingulodinium_polyedra.AAC.1